LSWRESPPELPAADGPVSMEKLKFRRIRDWDSLLFIASRSGSIKGAVD
jgi:hypothetical protein